MAQGTGERNNEDEKMGTLTSLPSFNLMKKESLGESYRCLNKSIKGKKLDDFDNVKDLVSTTEPLTRFQESLRLILIDSFQLTEHVINILLSQNNYQIKRILNCDWFFKNVLTPEKFCKDIFPHVSLFVRNKLIGKLSKKVTSVEDAEKFMTFIRENYGQVKAELFLPKCSSDFISKYFSEGNPSFQHNKSCKVLLFISRRYPTLVLNLFTKWLQGNTENQDILRRHELVLLYLASNHTSLFIPFFENNHSKLLFINFGKKISQKIGSHIKETLFKSSDLMKSQVFYRRAVFQGLPFNDQVKFITALVTFERDRLTFVNWINSRYDIFELLELVKPNDRLQMIESVFKKVYNLDLKDYVTMFDPQLLELIPLTSRVSYVEAYEKVLTADSVADQKSCRFYEGLHNWEPAEEPENYVYLYPFDVAFPKLKEALSKSPSIYRRQDIVRSMVRNCTINRDVEHLKDLVEYISARFRNDTSQTYVQFLNDVFRNFKLESFDSSVIAKVEEMLHLCFIKNERYNYGQLMEKCMTHRLSENLDVDNHVQQLFDWFIADRKLKGEFIHDYSGKHTKELFFKFYKEGLKRIEAIPELSDSIVTSILCTMGAYNRNRKKEPIRFGQIPELVSYVVEAAKKRADVLDDVGDVSGFEASLTWLLQVGSKVELFRELLKRKPEIFSKKLNEFLSFIANELHIGSVKNLFRNSIKILSFFMLLENGKVFILDKIKKALENREKRHALIMYSHICSLEEFQVTVQTYMPKGETVDTGAGTDFTEIQLVIPGYIRYLEPSWKNMDLILKFFTGDFFRYVLVSFYKCSAWTRVDHLIPRLMAYLEGLPKNYRIAVKKEVVRVLLNVSNFHEAVEICRNCWDAIDHYSIRTVLFKRITLAFLERPTRELFDLIGKFVRESDEMVIGFRPEMSKIPRDFFHEYVLLLWEFSETRPLRFKTDMRNSIIASLNMENVRLLPEDFCEGLLRDYLFRSGLDVKNFASLYLMADATAISRRMQFILRVFKESNAGPSVLTSFLCTLRVMTLRDPDVGVLILEDLMANWPFPDETILFQDRVILHHYALYLKIFGKSAVTPEMSEEFGRELRSFYLRHQGLHHLTSIFLDSLNAFTWELTGQNRELNLLIVFRELLGGEKNVSLAVLVVLAVSEDNVKLHGTEEGTCERTEDKDRKEMNAIVQLLREHRDATVQIYFHRKFGCQDAPMEGLRD